jgi:arylsulfatase
MHDDKVLEAPVEQHTLTERYTERALEFIRANRERPFLLYLPHTFPHSPLYAAKDREGRSPHGLYADVVEELDASTGRILDLLAELDIEERTLVIFTSDNGSHETTPNAKGRFGVRGAGGDNGPLKGRKGNTFEGGVRVPGIFWMPGRIAGGRTSGAVASALDILPTIAEMAGVELPSNRMIDGRSLAGHLLRNEIPRDRQYFYYFGGQLQAVRLGPWKLFVQITEYPKQPPSLWYQLQPDLFERHYRRLPQPELYNLDDDICESKNVAGDHPDVVERLSRAAQLFDVALQADKAEMVP